MATTVNIALSTTAYTAITSAGQKATVALRGPGNVRVVVASALPAADTTAYLSMTHDHFPAEFGDPLIGASDIIYLMAKRSGLSAEVVRG